MTSTTSPSGPAARGTTTPLAERPAGGRRRAGALIAAGAILATAVTCTLPPTPGAGCPTWSVRQVARGLPTLENVLVEEGGSLLLSMPGAKALKRWSPDGAVTTVAADLPDTGGLARHDHLVSVSTGVSPVNALFGTPNGTIVRIDPATGHRETWARGLVTPNGLAMLPDGSAVTTAPVVLSGVPSTVTHVAGDDPTKIDRRWSDLTGTNGAAVDPTGRWLYLSRSVASRAEVWRLPVDDPAKREKVGDVGAATTEFLDDLSVSDDGKVYVAAYGSGKVHRIDPATRAHCELATGLGGIVAVEWSPGSSPAGMLYAVSMSGSIWRLEPRR